MVVVVVEELHWSVFWNQDLQNRVSGLVRCVESSVCIGIADRLELSIGRKRHFLLWRSVLQLVVEKRRFQRVEFVDESSGTVVAVVVHGRVGSGELLSCV